MINFSVVNDWNEGFTGNLSITNSGTAAIDGWTIEFDAPFEITNLWNAEIVSRNGNRYVIRSADWNSTIKPNESISFGFNGKNPDGITIKPTNYRLNNTDIQTGDASPNLEKNTDKEDSTNSSSNPSTGEHNHYPEHNHDAGEHNHVEEPLPDNVNTDPLAEGGQTFYSDGTTQRITNFDPTKDKVDIGTDSIHNQIPIDSPEGLVVQNMFNPSRSLTLVGINLKDLRAENFNPIADAHLQQDLSAALAWENGTGNTRANTVYIRSHEEGLEETVDFNPATDKISFFYLSVRGDNQLNFSVEETAQGVRFFSPITGQSITLRGIQFSDLDSSHFEWRANQLEDNIAGRMGLSDKIANFNIVNDNIFSGKSVPMAGLVDRAPYHTNYPDYTGTPIGSTPPASEPTEPVEPVTPDEPSDPMADHNHGDSHNGEEPGESITPVEPPTSNSKVDFDIINDWGSGHQGQVKVTNDDSSPINSWTLEFEFSGKITQIWNAQIVSQNGNTYVISNAPYNGTIAPGQEVSFGFLGEGSTSILPNAFKLNGNMLGSPLLAEADEVDESIFDEVDEVAAAPVQIAGLGSPMAEVSAPMNEKAMMEEPDFVGTNNNDVINGDNNDNVIVGLEGNDRIKGRKGDDVIDGGLSNDRLWGNLGDDTLMGDEGKDILKGGRGSDHLLGGLNNDILIGSGYFRTGDNSSEVDTYTGGEGADKFVLGNRSHAFYTLGGDKDYALITDLNTVDGDTIQLNGQFSYSLGAIPNGIANGRGLFLEKDGDQELVAVIQSDSEFALTDSAFVYA